MRILLILYTTLILAWSHAESLDESRLPRRYSNDEANIKRLHIINRQTGFDGKVRNINIEENVPGIRAYGMPKKDLKNNGLIERINVPESMASDERSRNARVVEAYGMSKKRLDSNGIIERMPPVAIAKIAEPKDDTPSRRITRSTPEETKDELNDLEAQDAKVFRPLFVYRQQVAQREKLNKRRERFYGTPYMQNYRSRVHRYSAY